MLKKITVSALVTCGPGMEKYLPECIASLEAQTMPFTEIIIIFDGTQEGQAYENCTTVLRDKNLGVARSRHEAFVLSTGKFLLFVDADDALSENFLEEMIKRQLDSKAHVIYPNVLLWAKWGESAHQNKWHESVDEVNRENMLESCKIVVTSLMRSEVYEQCGPMENLPILEDYAFWMKAIEKGFKFAKAPKCYLKYRQRTEGRNRKSDELKNQIYQEVRERYENTGKTG